MKKIIITSMLLAAGSLAGTVSAQNEKSETQWGIGLRLGDPSGISIKKYTGDNALEFNIGRTHVINRGRYFDKRFDDWYWEQKFGYEDFDYISFDASAPIGLQLHYLFQKDVHLEGIKNLQWYYGIGGQIAFQTYYYDYRYKKNGDWFYVRSEKNTNLDFGADGVIGLEYPIPKTPVSVFIDVTLFLEVYDNPFAIWFQGGFGGRYNF